MSSAPISFDDAGSLRLLEDDRFEETERLKDECRVFVNKSSEFSNIVKDAQALMDSMSTAIEQEKLQAIGGRIQVETQKDLLKKEQHNILALIKERQALLERYALELSSLEKIEQEQLAVIEQLTNSQA